MAASSGTVGQTGNDFIISEQHLISIEPLFDLSIFIAIDKVKDRILYNKV
jgi:hypothetical protein